MKNEVAILDRVSDSTGVQHVPLLEIDSLPRDSQLGRNRLEVQDTDLVALRTQGVHDMAPEKTTTAHDEGARQDDGTKSGRYEDRT